MIATDIVTSWQTVKTNLLAIFEELKKAAPPWLGGAGGGFQDFARSAAVDKTLRDIGGNETGQSLRWLNDNLVEGPVRRYVYGGNNSLKRFFDQYVKGETPWQLPSTGTTAEQPQRTGSTVTVTGNPITINITAPTADPNAIGEAAGNALGSALRGVMADLPPLP